MTDKDNVIIMQLLADMGGIGGFFKMLNEEIDRRLQPFNELIDLATLTIWVILVLTIGAYDSRQRLLRFQFKKKDQFSSNLKFHLVISKIKAETHWSF